MFRPASAVRWYLPSRSMILTCFCGTILIAFSSDDQHEEGEDEQDGGRSCGRYLQNDAVGGRDADLACRRAAARRARRPVFAADVDPPGADRRFDVVRDDAFAADERSVRDGTPGAFELRDEPRPEQRRATAPSATTKTTTCAANPQPDAAAMAAAMRGEADEDDAEMRNRHLDDRRDDGEPDPRKRLGCRGVHGLRVARGYPYSWSGR